MPQNPPGPPTPGLDHNPTLLLAVLAGDEVAVATWYAQEHPQVYRLAVGLLADPNDAEDLAQDAMLHLLKQLPDCTDHAAYRGWRTQTVTNLCRDRLRRLKTRQFHERARHQPGPRVAEAADAAAEQREVRDMVTEALRQLPEREREVFVLRDLEQYSSRTCAELLSIAEGTVRSLLSLARRRLREILGNRLLEQTP